MLDAVAERLNPAVVGEAVRRAAEARTTTTGSVGQPDSAIGGVGQTRGDQASRRACAGGQDVERRAADLQGLLPRHPTQARQVLRLVLKGDVQGSVEAVAQALAQCGVRPEQIKREIFPGYGS